VNMTSLMRLANIPILILRPCST